MFNIIFIDEWTFNPKLSREKNGLKREDYNENSSSNKQKINYRENFLQMGNVYFIFKRI